MSQYQGWEYSQSILTVSIDAFGDRSAIVLGFMNKEGSEGWEFMHCHTDFKEEGEIITFMWKRPRGI